MSILDREVSTHIKRGFEISQRKTLKYGKRIYLERQKSQLLGIVSSTEGIYIYYVDGDSSVANIQEFLKDYGKFFDDMKFGKEDKAYFICSGNIDEKLFRDLKKSLIRSKASDIVRIKSFGNKNVIIDEAPLEKKKSKEKITEIKTEKSPTVKIDEKAVLDEIRLVQFVREKKERGYEIQLFQILRHAKYKVDHERLHKGARFDLVLGEDEIAIELKIIKDSSEFDRLFGQIHRYKDQFRKVIILLKDEFGNPSIMNTEIERIKQLDPEKIEIVVK